MGHRREPEQAANRKAHEGDRLSFAHQDRVPDRQGGRRISLKAQQGKVMQQIDLQHHRPAPLEITPCGAHWEHQRQFRRVV